MKLRLVTVPHWPKLAWVATFAPGGSDVVVRHGPCVERGGSWLAEAVWAGNFAAGDFDRTELVFGTGVRCRDDCVVFVSAGTMVDRLWYGRWAGRFAVSNSLPALLAVTGRSLCDDYAAYSADIEAMRLGLNKYRRTIPAEPSDLNVVYYRNLVYDGAGLREVDKPDTAPAFACYADYYAYLVGTARRLGANLEAPSRRHKVTPVASISSGYDAAAAAAIAREAGCRQALTIANSSSLLPRSDSGAVIARHLGLRCREFRHTPRAYRDEETVWAAAGRPAGLNLTVLDYPEPLALFFTGYRGDSMWRLECLDRREPFAAGSIAGLGMTEFRLVRGVFHCLVPFWGCRRAEQIQAITFSPEMAPWVLHSGYDRPIPRRILEEAGVPRDQFGHRKKATTAPGFFPWPFSRESMHSFARFVRARGAYAPSPAGVSALQKLYQIDSLIASNLRHTLGWKVRGLRPLLTFEAHAMLFQWANHELKMQYEAALKDVERVAP